MRWCQSSKEWIEKVNEVLNKKELFVGLAILNIEILTSYKIIVTNSWFKV